MVNFYPGLFLLFHTAIGGKLNKCWEIGYKYYFTSLVPRPLPNFISQLWRKIGIFSSQL